MRSLLSSRRAASWRGLLRRPPFRMRRPEARSTWVALAVALYLVAAGNVPLWRALAGGADAGRWTAIAACFLVLLAVYDLVLQAVALPWLLKPLAGLLLLVAAVSSWFMLEYGVLIDRSMIVNAVQTDASEAGELLTWRGAGFVAALGVLPLLLLALVRVRYGPARRELMLRGKVVLVTLAAAALLAWPAYKPLALTVRADPRLQLMVNPLTPLVSVASWAGGGEARAKGPLQPVGLDARRALVADGRRTLVVFVLGETATAGHFALNGYERDTNPELAALDVLNFPHVMASGTSTAESLPRMFSSLRRADFERGDGERRETLLDVLQRAGVEVLWRDNNSGCKGVCDRVPYEEIAGPPELADGTGHFYDEALLSGLQQLLDERTGDLFVVLHQRGSHGPEYWRRSPPAFKRFLPECSRADVSSCAREDIVNAYDNSILYTDHVLAQLIRLLAANAATSDTAMLYVSDHGESLGENGLYLHGFPRWLAPVEQVHVPMILWMSEGFRAARRLDPAALRAAAGGERSHDDLFHTVLGFFGVQTSVYDPSLDVLAACRR